MNNTLYFASVKSVETQITREYAAWLLKDGRPKRVGDRRGMRLWSVLDGAFFVRATRRCRYRAGYLYRPGDGVQCCAETDHEGSHKYKCASKRCPGFSWLASNTPHPTPPCF